MTSLENKFLDLGQHHLFWSTCQISTEERCYRALESLRFCFLSQSAILIHLLEHALAGLTTNKKMSVISGSADLQ